MDPVNRTPAPPVEAVGIVHTETIRTPPVDLRQLRWGPIWAGLLTALGLFVLLSLAAVSIGIQAAPTSAEQDDLGILAVIVTSVIALAAFFVGGFVSSWSAGLTDPGRSMLNGFLVWALWLVVVMVFAALGLGSVVGAMGELFGQVAVPDPDLEATEVIDLLRQSSWSSLLALGLTAAAATLGGVVGARDEVRSRWGGY